MNRNSFDREYLKVSTNFYYYVNDDDQVADAKVTWTFSQRERNLNALECWDVWRQSSDDELRARLRIDRDGEAKFIIVVCDRRTREIREKSHRGNAHAKSETIPAERFLLTKAFRSSQKRSHLIANSCISKLSAAVSLPHCGARSRGTTTTSAVRIRFRRRELASKRANKLRNFRITAGASSCGSFIRFRDDGEIASTI